MSSNTTKPPSSSPPKRRNGLHAACEPCRKAKIRCDRAIPTCSRCTKRRTPSLCVFIAAPMSHGTGPGASRLATSPPVLDSTERICGLGSIERLSGRETCEPRETGDESLGFLGSTSFSATIQQTNFVEAPKRQEAITLRGREVPDQRTHDLGVKVLSRFPSREVSVRFMDWHLSTHTQSGFHKPTIHALLVNFWDAFASELEEPRKVIDLERICILLTHNGRTGIASHDDPREWIAGFSGVNTRWETLGILFVAFSVTCISIGDGFLKDSCPGAEREVMIREMKECVEWCIELCRHSLNILVCNLLNKHLLLESIIVGDTALSVWRLLSDLVSTAVAQGLHCYQTPAKITLESEISKRLSATIFWADKELATFTGRPPVLSHRYCSSALPLDLSDEVLMEGGDALNLAVSKLDVEGWNTHGAIYDATISRMMAIYSLHMDRIMEIFVGNQAQWNLERVHELKRQASEIYASRPIHLQVSRKDLYECESDRAAWRLLCGRLDRLRLNFLLERLLTERGGASKKDLLEVARQMLDMILFLWLERDRLHARQHGYDFMIMCYGMPSIGVLCTELLQQARNPKGIDVKLPRSEIIQNLSLMIGFLDWVKPNAGNYKLCRRMSQVIKRTLDQFFEADPEDCLQENEMALLTPDFSTGDWSIQGLDDLEWLNSIDWTQGPYLDLNGYVG